MRERGLRQNGEAKKAVQLERRRGKLNGWMEMDMVGLCCGRKLDNAGNKCKVVGTAAECGIERLQKQAAYQG